MRLLVPLLLERSVPPLSSTRHAPPRLSATDSQLSRRALLTAAAAGATTLCLPAPTAADSSLVYRPLSTVDVGRGALARTEAQYSTTFAAYLSRFLLNYEPTTRRWWDAQVSEAQSFMMASEASDGIVGILGEERRDAYLSSEFSSLVTSIEVGLEAYRGENGATKLGEALAAKYTSAAQKRALAHLLCFIDREAQPTRLIASLIGETDASRLSSVSLEAGALRGYGAAAPAVTVAAPPSLERGGRTAKARALMRPTGRWREARVVDGGGGYAEGEVPEVTIDAPPEGAAGGGGGGGVGVGADAGSMTSRGTTARAVAVMRNGSVVRLQIVDAGSGYLARQGNATAPAVTRVQIAPPAALAGMAGGAARGAARVPRAELLAEFEIGAIEVTDGGTGYNADEPPIVSVAPPQPGVSGVGGVGGVGVAASIGVGGSALAASVANYTRLVADPPETRLRASLTPRPAPYYPPPNASELAELRRALERAARTPSNVYVGPATPPAASVGLPLPNGDRARPRTAQLLPLALVPTRQADGKFGLENVAVPAGAFGSRAAAPVQRINALQPLEAGKIFLAGGLCSSVAHTLLVPLDVVKTRLQTEPAGTYEGPIDCVRALATSDEGAAAFVQGAGATAFGYALAGSTAFGLLEVFSRAINEAAGAGNALFFSTPLLALASACATAICAAAVCPFEAARISAVRSGTSSLAALRQIVAEEGFGALYRGLGPIVLKEVPFVVTKFVVFDRVVALFGAVFPDAQGGALLAYGLPLAAGSVAGLFGALASQPADTLLTLTNEEGATLGSATARLAADPRLALQGLAPRGLFAMLLSSLQFLIYTRLRDLFGVSKADLTLVWDALATIQAGPIGRG